MPHFENIDSYESTHPETGEKRIVPVAPHSLQASEYRPRKREQKASKPAETAPVFQEVTFEPVNLRQMEREFKQAGRAERKSNRASKSRSGSIGLLARLKAFFLGKDKPKADRRRPKSRGPAQRDSRRKDSPRPRSAASPGAKPAEGTPNKRKRRRRPQENRPAGGQESKKQPGGGPRGPGQSAKKSSRPPGRNRRPRNRSRNPGSSGPRDTGPRDT